ncbi:MAG: L-lactate dehydrogenase, partial [Alphaproteobacteria bacterium]|nr:L-lactate dehydrogenase [Alphaproteobacteria bacterium]
NLVRHNAEVISDIVPKIMSNVDSKKVKLIIVTNPLDVMVMLAQKISKLPANRVIGTGTMLDSARLKIILSRQLGISTRSISAYVLGEHGDSSVLNWSSVQIGGIALNDFCKQTKLSLPLTTRKTIEHRVRNAAYEIIQGRGATWDGIGGAVADLLRAIIHDEKRILTTSIVDGIGSNAVAISMPRIIGLDGVITTLRPQMNKEEINLLKKSAKIIKSNFNLI